MIVDYPEKYSSPNTPTSMGFSSVDPSKEPMEQNRAFSLIEQVFSNAEDRIYKKSLKTSAQRQYIELSFISPFIGEKYANWIRELSKETNWPIIINPMANQAEISKVALELLNKNNIYTKKNPSILLAEGKVRVKLVEHPSEELWMSIKNDFKKHTGFVLEYTL